MTDGKSWEALTEQTKSPAEGDLSLDVKGEILDFRPTSQQGNRRNPGDPKDQRNIVADPQEAPKLVIGYGRSILFCTVLYH